MAGRDYAQNIFPNVTFEALGLAFIRNLALLAMQQQRGLMWVNS